MRSTSLGNTLKLSSASIPMCRGRGVSTLPSVDLPSTGKVCNVLASTFSGQPSLVAKVGFPCFVGMPSLMGYGLEAFISCSLCVAFVMQTHFTVYIIWRSDCIVRHMHTLPLFVWLVACGYPSSCVLFDKGCFGLNTCISCPSVCGSCHVVDTQYLAYPQARCLQASQTCISCSQLCSCWCVWHLWLP